MRTSSVLAFAVAVAPVVLAGPYFTMPIAGTVCTAGQSCAINWQDDGTAPDLATFGGFTIGVYAGQSLMQAVSPANAATTGSIVFIPDPAMGENSNAYFVKMTSVNAADPTNAMYKATAYSAVFTLTGMTGTFNATLKAQIAGPATSSGAGDFVATASAAPASTSAAFRGNSVSHMASSMIRSASGATISSISNAASSVHVAGLGAFGTTVAAVLAAFI